MDFQVFGGLLTRVLGVKLSNELQKLIKDAVRPHKNQFVVNEGLVGAKHTISIHDIGRFWIFSYDLHVF